MDEGWKKSAEKWEVQKNGRWRWRWGGEMREKRWRGEKMVEYGSVE